MSFIVVIPSRYDSVRLPGKPLVDILGKTMVERVAMQALKSGAKQVIVATDHELIVDAFANIKDIDVCMTSKNHSSGTDRLAEVCAKYQFLADEIIVNVQGDEPLIPVNVIREVAQNLQTNKHASMATLSTPITDLADVFNPNVVKVVSDKNNLALYFSRATIPWKRDEYCAGKTTEELLRSNVLYRHIGIYAYRVGFLAQYTKLSLAPLEQIEKLEQLRVLWHGYKIDVQQASEIPLPGIDTSDDLQRVIEHLKNKHSK